MKISPVLSAIAAVMTSIVSIAKHPDFNSAVNVIDHANNEIQKNLPLIQEGVAVLSTLAPQSAPLIDLGTQALGILSNLASTAQDNNSNAQANSQTVSPPKTATPASPLTPGLTSLAPKTDSPITP